MEKEVHRKVMLSRKHKLKQGRERERLGRREIQVNCLVLKKQKASVFRSFGLVCCGEEETGGKGMFGGRVRRHPAGTRCSASLENLKAQRRQFSLENTKKSIKLKRQEKEIMMAPWRVVMVIW